MSLTERGKSFFGIIDFPLFSNDDDTLINIFNDYCVKYCTEYSFAIHENEINENGDHEVKHIHFVIEKKDILRTGTELNNICMYLFNDLLCKHLITISKLQNKERAIRYLIHRDNPEKKQYDRSIIYTNLNLDLLNDILDNDFVTFDFNYLLSVIQKFRGNIKLIYGEIGLKNAVRYRNVINDIIKSGFD